MKITRTLVFMVLWVGGWSLTESLAGFPGLPVSVRLTIFLFRWVGWLVVLPMMMRAFDRWPLRGTRAIRNFFLLVAALFGAALVNGVVVTALASAVHLWWSDIPGQLTGFGALRPEAWRAAGQFVFFIFFPLLLNDEIRSARRRRAEAEQTRATLTRAKLHAMTVELQPHFIFNTLNSIATLVRSDPRTAETMIIQLSDLLRATLDGIEEGESSLGDEIERLEAYVALQRMRFGPRLNVTIAIAPELRTARIPAMVLQPLVENAMTHGIGPRDGPGHIEVTARRKDDSLVLYVIDDGVGLPVDLEKRMQIGLGHTRERLAMLFPSTHSFYLASRPEGGAQAIVAIPYQEMPAIARHHR